MKLSKRTVDILKSFTKIHENILLKPGNKLETMAEARNVFATVDITETIPTEVPIYNLGEFLRAVSLFDDPDFTFGDSSVKISGNDASVTYAYASKDAITYPQKAINVPPPSAKIQLPKEKFARVLTAANSLALETISLYDNGKEFMLKAYNPANDDGNIFEISLGESAGNNLDNPVIFKQKHLALIDADYEVQISPIPNKPVSVAKFVNEAEGLEYVIASSAA